MHRRLSIYEAMRLQGFPHSYELKGTFSQQVQLISDALPPPLGEGIAAAISRDWDTRRNPRPQMHMLLAEGLEIPNCHTARKRRRA